MNKSDYVEKKWHAHNPLSIAENSQEIQPDRIFRRDSGCCIAACGTARMREEFVGAVGLNKIARFRVDPRDTRSDAEYYELIGDESGVFGCMSLLACEDVCPKELPLSTQLAFIRRRMAFI